MKSKSNLGQWLEERCRKENLSSRQAGAKTGLSHQAIAAIIKGGRPTADTIRKLAKGFGGTGKLRLALEDELLALAGYRTPRPKEEISPDVARLIDIVSGFSKPQLEITAHFAEFLLESTRTLLKTVCMYCKKEMGVTDGKGISGDSGSICPECWSERFPGVPYPEKE